MPVPHFNIKITQRSKGKSAVAGAAYQAGEKLFSEYDQKTKNYTCKKEVVYTEIMLPPNAPPEYADRATLWNSVEEIEKQWNSQLARRFVAALPREVPMELLPQMVKEYCEEQFVSKGMCCDFAIHDPDPPGHNPHCHFMLTMRAIDENGKWMPKSRKVYDLDENGERIKLPSGRWKSHTYIDAARAGHPYDVNNLPREPLSLMYLFLALGIGLVLAWVVVSVMKSQLRSVAFQENAASYVREGSMNLTNSRELFLYRNVQRTKHVEEKDSDSSGGSSTHTSSSGTTHGGGGGSF